MISFIKILAAPPTWKSEPIFAAPRYLIRALGGEFLLLHYQADERSFVVIGSAASRAEAECAAERHLTGMALADIGLPSADITLSA
jgi:hypothetical protein